MAFGDIKLEEERVTVNGRWMHVNCWDLHLNHPERRGDEGSSPFRRAMVHDSQDGLTLNYNQDYPGGITLRGTVNVKEN